MNQLEQLLNTAPERIEAAADLADLKDIENDLLGRKSIIANARRTLGSLDPEQRPVVGARLNEATKQLSHLIQAKRQGLERSAENRLLLEDRVDVTLPVRELPHGWHHLITQTLEEVSDIFVSLGYKVVTGPEVDTAFHNFDALNTPPTHPARLESDTMYVDYGNPDDELLLRTQTSTMQVRYMEQNDPPVYIVAPGRCYRTDTLDATHSPVFHQIEGLAVDEDITMAGLKGTLAYFMREFLGSDRQIRLLPHFFPFTEPSAEMLVSCFGCDGSGCRVCGKSGWIELLGCGVVDPHVLESVGYDSTKFSGFAFGVGAERLAMVRHGIDHIRHFYENDLRVLRQFT
jgi:phenylalanyl-tRNA synthetase alpha chain